MKTNCLSDVIMMASVFAWCVHAHVVVGGTGTSTSKASYLKIIMRSRNH